MQIGVCDDQKEIRELIIDKIKKFYPTENITSYKSGQEVLDDLYPPDILFLDIQMPEMDGMGTAAGYVLQSFDVGAFHYLVKPFSDEKFAEVLQNAVRQFQKRKMERMGVKKEIPSLMITSKGEHIAIPLQDIVYAEVFNRKIVIHTMDADIEYYGKMKDLEKKAGEDFYRPHRAYLINFNFVRKYNATIIYLQKGQAFMAKQNYQGFVKSYLRFNQRKRKG